MITTSANYRDIKTSANYRDIKHFKSFDIVKEHGLGILKESIEGFLNCKLTYLYQPVEQAKKIFGIDLLQNPRRGCYPIDNQTFFIFVRVLDSNVLISGLGLILSSDTISKYVKFLNDLEGALAKRLSLSYSNWFEDCSRLFGDELITHSISNYCIRGHFDYRHFLHLIDYFHKLKSTTFEGSSFSTGLIITKSFFAYKKKGDETRYGDIFPLTKRVEILNTFSIDRRFWYLADGKHTFFVCNNKLQIGYLFAIDEKYGELNYIDNNTLAITLKGGDVLLKVENEKQFSIINSDGIEFLYLENRWKIRNYKVVRELLSQLINDENVANKLLFYILYCSKNAISSVIWVPEDISIIADSVKEDTLNKLVHSPISILDRKFTNHIMRYLSSDGATVFDKDGNLCFYGCIVDMKDLEIKGVKGTGESAAEVLSDNGISFKISQDGTIKIFSNHFKKHIVL